MPALKSIVPSLALLCAAAGCQGAPPAESSTGSVEFALGPARSNVHAPPLRGAFTLRGLDSEQKQRVLLTEEPYPPLRVALPSGSYLLAWEPELRLDTAGIDGLELEVPARGSLPTVIVVAPHQVTAVKLRVTPVADLRLAGR